MNCRIDPPKPLKSLSRRFTEAGGRLLLVGGFVRNSLLGFLETDLDCASNLLPEEVARLADGSVRVTLVNERLGTVKIETDGLSIEHTTFRTESYGAGGAHRPEAVKIGATLLEDAYRRDFTVNALYADALTGEILDPTGRGLADLARRTIATTTLDPKVILADDGLRLLRMIRLAAELGFSIDRPLFLCARENAALIDDISPERVFAEFSRILLADAKYKTIDVQNLPMPAHKRALLYLTATGLLFRIIPELLPARGMVQGKYHRYTVLLHCISACSYAPPDLTLRMAALLHDVGKPYAMQKNGNMHRHDTIGVGLAREILTRLRSEKAFCERVCRLIAWHMYDLNAEASENKLRIAAVKLGKADFLALADLREADFRGSAGKDGRVLSAERFRETLRTLEAEGAPFSTRELAIDGKALMEALSLSPGPEVGKLLADLLAVCVRNPSQNTKERLLHHAQCLLKQYRRTAGEIY